MTDRRRSASPRFFASKPRRGLVACLLAAALAAASVPVASAGSAESAPRVVAVYPTPVADGDTGEHVVVDPGGAGNLTLADGEEAVRVPAGGLSRREASVLDRLTRRSVAVRVLGGPRACFAFQHAKYPVADDRAFVLTENWKPSGTGGRDNRGWGVRVASSAVAADLAGLFGRDFGAHDARPWTAVRRNRTFSATPSATGSYPSRLDPRRVQPRPVHVLTAPGNAERAVVGVVDDAERRVDVLQPTLGGTDVPFVRAVVRAAERDVRVRILLSGA